MAFLRIFLLSFVLFLPACTFLLFHPVKTTFATPDMIGMKYEDVFIPSSGDKDVYLHGWYVFSKETPKKGTVLFLHGNAENISTHFFAVSFLVNGGYDVFALDYRGYGSSTGSPSLSGMEEDVRDALKYLRERNASERTIVLAQSIGASLAISAFSERTDLQKNICLMVLDSPFESVHKIVRSKIRSVWILWPLWPFQYPVSWLFGDNDADEKIAGINVPKLFITTTDDPIVPFEQVKNLFRKAEKPKDIWIGEGGHIQSLGYENARKKLFETMEKTCRP